MLTGTRDALKMPRVYLLLYCLIDGSHGLHTCRVHWELPEATIYGHWCEDQPQAAPTTSRNASRHTTQKPSRRSRGHLTLSTDLSHTFSGRTDVDMAQDFGQVGLEEVQYTVKCKMLTTLSSSYLRACLLEGV